MKPYAFVYIAMFALSGLLGYAGKQAAMCIPFIVVIGSACMAMSCLRQLVQTHLRCSERYATEETLLMVETFFASGEDGDMRQVRVRSTANKRPDLQDMPLFKSLRAGIKLLGPPACYPLAWYWSKNN
jgi:hypothetical protein